MPADRPAPHDISLIETMRLEEGRIVRRDAHLARARASAAVLGTEWKPDDVERALRAAVESRRTGVWRMRLLISPTGDPVVEGAAFTHDPNRVWRVVIAGDPVPSEDLYLRHKTTHRELYNRARAARPDADDVLLVNERDEITEATIANVVAEIGGVKVTPPLSCGLLPGVFRASLLDAGEVQERVIRRDDLATADRLWLVNSLREWIGAVLVG